MRVAFDSSSDEEEPLFNMEDIDRKAFENDKELPLLTQFLNALKKLGEDRNSLKSTICYCGVFMVFGMSDEILGPTLLELKCLTGKSITVMSVLFFVHDLCNVFGSTSGGYLVDRWVFSWVLNCAALFVIIANSICGRIRSCSYWLFWCPNRTICDLCQHKPGREQVPISFNV